MNVGDSIYDHPEQHADYATKGERDRKGWFVDAPSPQTGRQMDYIRALQQRNRIKKALSAKSEEELQQERRERGFDNYINGANDRRPRHHSEDGSSDGGGGRSRSDSSRSASTSSSHRSLHADAWEPHGSRSVEDLVVHGVGATARRSSSSAGGVALGGPRSRSHQEEEERGGDEEAHGRRRRKSWAMDQPLQYIAGEDGRLVAVRRREGVLGGQQQPQGGGNMGAKEGAAAGDGGSPGGADQGPGGYEEDFEDEHEDHQQQQQQRRHDDTTAPSYSYYEDDLEEEEEESLSLDEERVHRAIVHQTRQQQPGGEGGGGTMPRGLRDVLIPTSTTGIAAAPLSPTTRSEQEEEEEEEEEICSLVQSPSVRAPGGGGGGGASGGDDHYLSDSLGSEAEEVGSLVEDRSSGGHHSSMGDENVVIEEDAYSNEGSLVREEGSVYVSEEEEQDSDDADELEEEEEEEADDHQSTSAVAVSVMSHGGRQQAPPPGNTGPQVVNNNNSHQTMRPGSGRRSTHQQTPVRASQAVAPLGTPKAAGGGNGERTRGEEEDENMRQVLAAMERENHNTPRAATPTSTTTVTPGVTTTSTAASSPTTPLRPLSRTSLRDSDLFGFRPDRTTTTTTMKRHVGEHYPPTHAAMATNDAPPRSAAVSVDHILSALDMMSPEEKRKVLDKLYAPSSSATTTTTTTSPQPPPRHGADDEKEGKEEGAKEGHQGQVVKGGKEEEELLLTIRIHNTWGGTKVVGIEQVALLDCSGRSLSLTKEDLGCRTGLVRKPVAATDKMVQDLGKLVDGVVGSNSDSHMWLARLGGDSPLDLVIRIKRRHWLAANNSSSSRPLRLHIWNYGHAPQMMTGVGVKDVDVLLGNRWIWSGVIKEGVPGRPGSPTIITIEDSPSRGAFATTASSNGQESKRSATHHRHVIPSSSSSVISSPSPAAKPAGEHRHGFRGAVAPALPALVDTGDGDRATVEAACDHHPIWLPTTQARKPTCVTTTATKEGRDVDDGVKNAAGQLRNNRSSPSMERRRGTTHAMMAAEEVVTVGNGTTPTGSGGSSSRLSRTRGDVGGQEQQQPSSDQRAVFSGKKKTTTTPESTRVVADGEEGGDTPVGATTTRRREGGATGVKGEADGAALRRTSRRYQGVEEQSCGDQQRVVGSRTMTTNMTTTSTTTTTQEQEGEAAAGAEGAAGPLVIIDGRGDPDPAGPCHPLPVNSQEGEVLPSQQPEALLVGSYSSTTAPGGGGACKGVMPTGMDEEGDALAQEALLLTQRKAHKPAPPATTTTVTKEAFAEARSVYHPMATPPPLHPYLTTVGAPPPLSLEASPSRDDLLTDLYRDVLEEEGSSPSTACGPPPSLVDIPILPSGRVLDVVIWSTWGDAVYMGLAGIDLFDGKGEPIAVGEGQVFHMGASDKDRMGLHQEEEDDDEEGVQQGRALPSTGSAAESRALQRLFDGINFTCDDLHAWMAPFQPDGKPYRIRVNLCGGGTKGKGGVEAEGKEKPVVLSMVRFWNYNKSRTHASRGVRRVQLVLDGDRVVFDGHVRKAPGDLIDPDQCCEVVLFTLDDSILSRVEESDRRAGFSSYLLPNSVDETSAWVSSARTITKVRRPDTGGKEGGGGCHQQPQARDSDDNGVFYNSDETSGGTHKMMTVAMPGRYTTAAIGYGGHQGLLVVDESSLHHGRRLELRLDGGTWGDRDFIGLGAVQVLEGRDLVPVSLRGDQVDCLPVRDLRSLGYGDDSRVLQNLVAARGRPGGPSSSGGDGGAYPPGWLLPLSVASRPTITIDLGESKALGGLLLWNYDREEEDDTLRGARTVTVALDGKTLGLYALRKGAASSGVSREQLLLFGRDSQQQQQQQSRENLCVPGSSTSGSNSKSQRNGYVTYVSPPVKQDYETLMHPTGLLLKITLHCSWGDAYYLGLDGLQLLGATGQEVAIQPEKIQAWPSSLLVLGQEDCRVPANLVDGVVGSVDGTHAWLAPFAGSLPTTAGCPKENVLCVLFDSPVCLGAVRFWNYSKTPSRGVRELSISLDGRLLYRGGLRRASCGEVKGGGSGGEEAAAAALAQTILFTNDPGIVRKDKENVLYCGSEEQDVLCIDERQVRVRSRFVSQDPDPSAEGVTIDVANRPGTAVLPTTGGGGKQFRVPLKSTMNNYLRKH